MQPASLRGDAYPVPELASRDVRVFTTAFKIEVTVWLGVTTTAAWVVPPLLAAWVATWLAVEGGAWYGLLAAATVAAVAASREVSSWLSAASSRHVHRGLAARLEKEGLSPEDGQFVAFAPGLQPRLYEGFSELDLGFVFLGVERLVFVGDRVRFALRRDQIVLVAVTTDIPAWRPALRAQVTYTVEGREQALGFSVPGARTLAGSRRATRAWARRVDEWRAGRMSPAAVDVPLAPDLPPRQEDVTSSSPRTLVQARTVLPWLGVTAVTALICALALDLDLELSLAPHASAWHVVAAAVIALLLHALPGLRDRPAASEVRVDSQSRHGALRGPEAQAKPDGRPPPEEVTSFE